MDFVTIDFETATNSRNSACELGVTIVNNNNIEASYSWLIKHPEYPFMSYFNSGIHGIIAEDLSEAATFPEVWEEAKAFVDGKFVIAHNAGFDMSVLNHSLAHYGLKFPSFNYACSYRLAKKIWPSLSGYNQKSLADRFGIQMEEYHRAESDSHTCAKIALQEFKDAGINTIEDIGIQLQVMLGEFSGLGHQSFTSRIRHHSSNEVRASHITSKKEAFDPDCLFYDKRVCITGKLGSMERKEAWQKLADSGAHLTESVTANLDILIVGQQDYRYVGDTGMSSKQRKALDLFARGSGIEIISEEEFLQNLI